MRDYERPVASNLNEYAFARKLHLSWIIKAKTFEKLFGYHPWDYEATVKAYQSTLREFLAPHSNLKLTHFDHDGCDLCGFNPNYPLELQIGKLRLRHIPRWITPLENTVAWMNTRPVDSGVLESFNDGPYVGTLLRLSIALVVGVTGLAIVAGIIAEASNHLREFVQHEFFS
jgi:hypothetical protein